MNHGLGPDSTGVSQLVSRAVEIALAVKSDALVRFSSVGASGEAVEHGVSPAVGGRCQPKNRARAEIAALHGRAIETARAVDYQIGVDVLTIVTSREAVDDLGNSRGPGGA